MVVWPRPINEAMGMNVAQFYAWSAITKFITPAEQERIHVATVIRDARTFLKGDMPFGPEANVKLVAELLALVEKG